MTDLPTTNATYLTDEETDRRVARGSALLTRRRPSWYNEVDLETLDLRSLECCVVAQLYGDYDTDALIGKREDLDAAAREDVAYGFDLPEDACGRSNYAVLTEAWVREVERLRGGAR